MGLSRSPPIGAFIVTETLVLQAQTVAPREFKPWVLVVSAHGTDTQ